MTFLEAISIAAVIGILALVFIGTGMQNDAYKEACIASGGKPVFDGRQWQCFK